MRWLDRFTKETTMSEVEAALRAASVELEVTKELYGDGPVIRFDADSFHYSIELDASNRVIDRGAWRELPREEGLRLVAEALRDATSVIAMLAKKNTSLRISWLTPERNLVLSLHEDPQRLAHLRCDMRDDANDPVACIAAEAYVSRLTSLRGVLADAPAGSGERGHAIARWRTHLASRLDGLASLIATVLQATPNAMLVERQLVELAKDVEQLAAHETLFPGEHDWRDALVVGDRNTIPYGDVEQFGWRMELAGEGISGKLDPHVRAVRLVEGPFAYGLHRVLRANHELYAVHDSWPVDEVLLTDPAELALESDPEWLRDYDPAWLRDLGGCIATLGDTELVLMSMNGDVRRIATLLVCARASKHAGA